MIDCPFCDEPMEFRKNQVLNTGKIKVEKLSGHFCEPCSEGFYDIDSKNKIKSAILKAKKLILKNRHNENHTN